MILSQICNQRTLAHSRMTIQSICQLTLTPSTKKYRQKLNCKKRFRIQILIIKEYQICHLVRRNQLRRQMIEQVMAMLKILKITRPNCWASEMLLPFSFRQSHWQKTKIYRKTAIKEMRFGKNMKQNRKVSIRSHFCPIYHKISQIRLICPKFMTKLKSILLSTIFTINTLNQMMDCSLGMVTVLLKIKMANLTKY